MIELFVLGRYNIRYVCELVRHFTLSLLKTGIYFLCSSFATSGVLFLYLQQ